MGLKVSIIGAGPAGLYLACLLRRGGGNHEIRIVEQDSPDSTFGFGVAFSHRALELLRRQDEETWAAVRPYLEFWNDSVVSLNGESVRIDGMGYAGIGRLRLLQVLQEQAERLGIRPDYGRVVRSPEEFADSDLIVGADGANSVMRNSGQQGFGATLSQFNNRFAWFGTRRRFDALTHTFLETEHGAFNAHHHRHAPDMSTFVVEVDEATFFRCGFESMGPEKSQALCESIFASVLNGESLISNKSIWRRFERISNRNWWSGNRVLLGDALHTAHFSIGSGTRMAMEDALALAAALNRHTDDVPAALADFEQARMPIADRLVAAADASAQWYEQFATHMRLPLMEFAMSYVTRSGRVDVDRLRRGSASFMAEYEAYRAGTAKRLPRGV
jgi:2-polyprenyl-6-methoxyphenol hydroxylase-like FAD-dependent oxidoreductase